MMITVDLPYVQCKRDRIVLAADAPFDKTTTNLIDDYVELPGFSSRSHDDMLDALSRICDAELQMRFPSSGWGTSDKPPEVISRVVMGQFR
jgi:hypothetical protein